MEINKEKVGGLLDRIDALFAATSFSIMGGESDKWINKEEVKKVIVETLLPKPKVVDMEGLMNKAYCYMGRHGAETDAVINEVVKWVKQNAKTN